MLKVTYYHDIFCFGFLRAGLFLHLVLILGYIFVTLQDKEMLCKSLHRSEQSRDKPHQNMEFFLCTSVALEKLTTNIAMLFKRSC